MLQAEALDHLAQDARCIRPRLTGLVRLPNRLQSKLQAGLKLSALLKGWHTSVSPAGHCSTACWKSMLIAPRYSQEAQRRSKANGFNTRVSHHGLQDMDDKGVEAPEQKAACTLQPAQA